MDQTSNIAFIEDAPQDPAVLFSDLLKAYKAKNPENAVITMNIATLDDQFGVLNRTVMYRGLEEGHILFVTEKNSVKYANLIKDPRISVCFLFEEIPWNNVNTVWQVRLMGEAIELSANQLTKLWAEEPMLAKIRSRISECGKPVEYSDQKNAHDKLLKDFENGQDSLPQTDNYTAFKIAPKLWDFYKSEFNSMADRVQYRKGQPEVEKWCKMHVAC